MRESGGKRGFLFIVHAFQISNGHTRYCGGGIWIKTVDTSNKPGVTLPQQELGASLGYKLKPAWALRASATSPDRSLEFYAAE